jgi:hypothetical protein
LNIERSTVIKKKIQTILKLAYYILKYQVLV